MHIRSQHNWKQLIAEIDNSLGAKERTCKRLGVSVSAYYHQRKQLALAIKPSSNTKMLPVKISESTNINPALPNNQAYIFRFPSGAALEFSEASSTAFVANLILALG